MSSLGSLFPKSVKQDFSNRAIRSGSVFKIHTTNTTPPKIKRIVVLAISGDKACIGYLFVNSKINPNVFPTARLRSLHFLLKSSACEYLDHDSYLDCSNIQDISMDDLTKIMLKDPSHHIGQLSESDLENAKSIVRNAPTVSEKQKEKYNLIPQTTT